MKRLIALAITLTVLTAGCGDGDGGGTFDAGTGTAPLACMPHQKHAPAKDYTDDTARTFTLLRYYVANGARPYCDHRGADAEDRAWAHLYERLGGDPHAVEAILTN